MTSRHAGYMLTPLLVEKAGVAPDVTFRITACKQERVQARYPLWIWNPWGRIHEVQNRSNQWLHKIDLGPDKKFKKKKRWWRLGKKTGSAYYFEPLRAYIHVAPDCVFRTCKGHQDKANSFGDDEGDNASDNPSAPPAETPHKNDKKMSSKCKTMSNNDLNLEHINMK